MGRPPNSGGPAFRFTHAEVMELEARLNEVNNALPPRELIAALADKFSASPERVGKIAVQPKQVWNWFQNRRYSQRSRTTKSSPGKLNTSPMMQDELGSFGTASPAISNTSGKVSSESNQVEFEAKSARDGAWYDVAAFLSHRMFETGDPDVRVRFSGFGAEEDEWINVRKCVRQRSLPCEAAECVAVLPGDLILCFQEGKEQALYFDAHVLDAQRRRHDVRGCRCRFLVRYDHDQSEEIVPLRKVCRRPETDYRLQILQASRAAAGSMDNQVASQELLVDAPKDTYLVAQRAQKQRKMMDVNTDEVTTIAGSDQDEQTGKLTSSLTAQFENGNDTAPEVLVGEATPKEESVDEAPEESIK